MQQHKELIQKLAQNTDDRLMLAKLLEKADTCREKCYMTYTHFLDMSQAAIAEQALMKMSGNRWCFLGGYEQAERRIIAFLPDYMEEIEPEDMPITVIRCTKNKEDNLSHRDYLGSVMGMQIKRECIGDILVSEHGADMIVLKDIAPFLLMNYTKAGRKHIHTEEIPLSELYVPEPEIKMLRDTVASLRLDAVCSSLFRISRTKASDYIRTGRVFLNNRPCIHPDKEIHEKDKITIRGIGKGELDEIIGESRKQRIVISLKKFV